MIFTEKDLPNTMSEADKAFILSYQHEYQERLATERQQLQEKYSSTLTDEVIENFATFKFPQTHVTKNPTNLTNPYWQWVIQHRLSPQAILAVIPHADPQLAEKRNFGESTPTAELPPVWCFDRMGQSRTLLPDGREILIGGEFDDYYDPNFCIYNDVVVRYPDGNVEIFGYPTHIFPPTDFHTATLLGDKIYIIGSMGYFDQRHYTETPIYQLDIHTLQIERVESRNHIGWINDHQAIAKDGQILISGGRIFDNDDSPMRENFNTWAFNPKTLIWKNITNRQWQGFWMTRKDLLNLSVSQYDWLLYRLNTSPNEETQQILNEFEQNTGLKPDIELYAQLFRPPMPHEVEEQTVRNTFVIYVDEIKVRYVTDSNYIQVYIEGILPPHKLELLQENLRHKLSKLENFACEVKDLVF